MNVAQKSDRVSGGPPESGRLACLTAIGLLLIGGLFLCGVAHAGSIYKCPSPSGTYEYTDVSCGPRARVVHVTGLGNDTRKNGGEGRSVPAKHRDVRGVTRPAAQAQRGDASSNNFASQYKHESSTLLRSDMRLDSSDDRHAHTHVPLTGNVPPSAYECIAASKHWIQMAACPPVYLKDPRSTTDDPATNSEPERGSYVLLERVPVHQQPLDKSELCRKLDDDSIPVRHSGRSDVYERNVARSEYCP